MNYSAFAHDTRTQHACIRNLVVIGEAVKKIPEDTRIVQPEIPWQKIAGLRDILTHEYFGIDTEILWDVIANKLDSLYMAVQVLKTYHKPNL